MSFWIKSAVVGGLIGLLVMALLWFSGPPRYLWEFLFWPSQLVGLGTDDIRWMPEITVQFTIYALVGLMVGFVCRLVRRAD
jgi:hypothetical protein